MSTNDQAQGATRQSMTRRAFLRRTGWGSVGVTGLIIGRHPSRALAHPPSPYPSWIPASDKPPQRGGILTQRVPRQMIAIEIDRCVLTHLVRRGAQPLQLSEMSGACSEHRVID